MAALFPDGEYFGEVKLGVGTARALQGRLSEAAVHFASAQKMDQKNEKLKASLAEMTVKAEQLEAIQASASRVQPTAAACI